MRCINCNYDNLEGMRYCVSCGQELITVEEKSKRAEESKKGLVVLYIIIGVLVVVLLVVLGFVIFGGGPVAGDVPDKPGNIEEKTSVHADTVGAWKCSTQAASDKYTILIQLNEDGTFIFGPATGYETNYIGGTFTSNSYGATDSSKQYNLYSLNLRQTVIVENGVQQEGYSEVNYSVGINTKDKNDALFSNGQSGTTYYCKK